MLELVRQTLCGPDCRLLNADLIADSFSRTGFYRHLPVGGGRNGRVATRISASCTSSRPPCRSLAAAPAGVAPACSDFSGFFKRAAGRLLEQGRTPGSRNARPAATNAS